MSKEDGMNRQRTLRLLALIAALWLAMAAVACADDEDDGGGGSGDTAAEENSTELALNGRKTVLTLNEGVVAVLEKNKVKVAPVEPAAPGGAGVQFPITGGTVDAETLAGTIAHSGGLIFSVAGEKLEVTDFMADTESGLLNATAGAAELPILALDLSGVKKSTKGDAIVASGIKASLTGYGAAAMNAILDVKIFKEGLPLGELTVTATAVS
jgi:hypothetical protein